MRITRGFAAAAFFCALSINPVCFAAEAGTAAELHLEMSQSLTLDPTGSPPAGHSLEQPPVPPAASDDGFGNLPAWLTLLLLVPAAFLWGRRRAASMPAATGQLEEELREATLQERTAEVTRLSNDLARHQAAREAGENRIAELESRLGTAAQEARRLGEEHDEQVGSLRAEIARSDEDCARQETRAADFASRLAAMDSELRELRDERDTEVRTLTDELSQSAADGREHVSLIKELESRFAMLHGDGEEKIAAAERRASLAESSAQDELRRAQTQADEARATGEMAVAVAEGAARDLTRGLLDAQKRVAELAKDNGCLAQAANDAEAKRAEASTTAKAAEAQLTAVMGSVQEYKETARAKVESIAKKFARLLEQRDSLVAELQRERIALAQYVDIEKENAEKDEAIARLDAEVASGRKVIAAMEMARDANDTPASSDTISLPAAAMRRELVQTRLQIKSLEADLRVRADLISAFEDDTNELPQLEDEVESQAATISMLQNELSLAIAELARAKNSKPQQVDAIDVARAEDLESRLRESEQRAATQGDIIAHLEEELFETTAGGTIEQHLGATAELEQDLSASGSLIRYLEDEVAQLRSGPRAAPGSG